MTSENEHDSYHPPDLKYIEEVLGVVEREHNVSVGQVDIYVARPGKGPMSVPDAGAPLPEPVRTETAYDALLREVPRLVAELGRFESEHRQVVGLLLEMCCGDFHLESHRFAQANDVPGELGEQRRQALMMWASMTRGQESRDMVRERLRLRGEFSER